MVIASAKHIFEKTAVLGQLNLRKQTQKANKGL